MKLLKYLLDKDLIKSLFLSIIYFLYTKVIIIVLLHIPDIYLLHILNPIIFKKINDELSDESSDESSDELLDNIKNSQYNTLEEYKTSMQLWEYDVILHLFKVFLFRYLLRKVIVLLNKLVKILVI